MTITILKPGANLYHVHCAECSCQFTYDLSDVHTNYRLGRDQVGCPTCGKPVLHWGARSALAGCALGCAKCTSGARS